MGTLLFFSRSNACRWVSAPVLGGDRGLGRDAAERHYGEAPWRAARPSEQGCGKRSRTTGGRGRGVRRPLPPKKSVALLAGGGGHSGNRVDQPTLSSPKSASRAELIITGICTGIRQQSSSSPVASAVLYQYHNRMLLRGSRSVLSCEKWKSQ